MNFNELVSMNFIEFKLILMKLNGILMSFNEFKWKFDEICVK